MKPKQTVQNFAVAIVNQVNDTSALFSHNICKFLIFCQEGQRMSAVPAPEPLDHGSHHGQ